MKLCFLFLLVSTLVVEAIIFKKCNQHTSCADCEKESACVWCDDVYATTPAGKQSGCHKVLSVFGCLKVASKCPASTTSSLSPTSSLTQSPSPSPSLTSSSSLSTSTTDSISQSPSPTPSASLSTSLSSSSSLTSSISNTASVSPSLTYSPTASVSPSRPAFTTSRAPTPSSSRSPTPTPSMQGNCKVYYYTDCSVTHPGCSRTGFLPAGVSQPVLTFDSDGTRSDVCTKFWKESHWKCCLVEPQVPLLTIQEVKAVPTQSESSYGVALYPLVGVASAAIFITLTVRRITRARRTRQDNSQGLAAQDAAAEVHERQL